MAAERSVFFIHNGDILPANQPVVTASNRAFRYGDGFFETMRLKGGLLHLAPLHAARIAETAIALGMSGVNFSAEKLQALAADLDNRNQWNGNARLRLTIYRDGSGTYTPQTNSTGYVLTGEVLASNEFTLNTRGIIANVYPEHKKPLNSLSQYKTCNSLLYVLAGNYRVQHDLDDAIILNQQGNLCETINANIFVVYENKIYTPALSEGCINGVMRSHVIDMATQHGHQVFQAQLHPNLLDEATEVFVTNAVSGISWIMGFKRRRYFNNVSRSLIHTLNTWVAPSAGEENV